MTDQTKEALAPLPSTDDLDQCPSITQAAADMLSWIDGDTVAEALGELGKVEPVSLRHVRHFLLLMETFRFRIRKSRRGDDPEHGLRREPADRLILEDGGCWQVLADRSESALREMQSRGLLAFDPAGVLHLTDKGRALSVDDGRTANGGTI